MNKSPGFFQRWKMNAQFPIVWLTYRYRISKDVEYFFRQDRKRAEEILNEKYIEDLSKTILRLEERVLKLSSIQFTLIFFFVIAFLSDTPSITLFGVALSGVAGLKELLVVLWLMLGFLATTLIASKDMLTSLANAIEENRTGGQASAPPFSLPFSKLRIPASFGFYVYATRPHEDWIFSTIATKSLTVLISLFVVLGYLILLLCSFALAIHLLIDIYSHPGLGRWSYAIVAYSCLIIAASILILVRVNAPLPYRDKSELKRLSELEHTNPAAFVALRNKLFGRP